MLTHLRIKNFAIIDELDLDISSKFNVITGETGAGKSIVIGALELVLGERADNNAIRHGQDKADITASFDITHNEAAKNWLQEQELENENECIIRRVLHSKSRSKFSINGTPITATQIKQLAESLINIHGQHQHQSLLKREYQLQLLDNFADHNDLVQQVTKLFHTWRDTKQQLEKLQTQTGTDNARIELLQYQLQELEALSLQKNEVKRLHEEQKQLANAANLIQNCQTALSHLNENDTSVTSQLNQSLQLLEANDKAKSIIELVNNALIQTEEAANELRHYVDKLEINPEKLTEVETRLNLIHDIARKHHIEPEKLAELQSNIATELDQLKHVDKHIAALKKDIEKFAKSYQTESEKLTKSRRKAAKILSANIQNKLQQLGMPGGKFDISLQPNKDNAFASYGLEHAEFLVSANPGQPLQPLTKVASGGEISRISLAIQVITAQTTTTPTLVFDEVDVGIGGGTAEIVGNLLRELGEKAQILCITHLPQVAAKGHQHYQVQKQTDGKTTSTNLQLLTQNERQQEIARMLGGVKITDKTLAHASEMLSSR